MCQRVFREFEQIAGGVGGAEGREQAEGEYGCGKWPQMRWRSGLGGGHAAGDGAVGEAHVFRASSSVRRLRARRSQRGRGHLSR
ncbi:hypothetical protein AQI88_26100 [Streptomyces cellostaticus]|uniref:Uncharacterized protein n=1 Tax=Streptomyces cellostaticus TaxID=67285 RepID=A0A101NI14_9ACTN|nr:hypothetical protein AQI88_26100 [Streptomyces cellostaticus]